MRAKAKVLYRSDDHKESLALSKTLIESDAPLDEVEKAFLGRDAAISAEKQGDFKAARRYYLFGSTAAHKSTDNLEQFLPRGPVLEGQMLLSPAIMHKALSRLDAKLFVKALQTLF